jgi:hypothetical protein
VFDFRRADAARHQDGRQNGALQLSSGVELLQADDGVLSNCISHFENRLRSDL